MMMNITSAKYFSINGANISVNIVVDGKKISVPMDTDNSDYAEIMRQQSEGLLTIADAD
jgi:hypothetical protein